MTEAKMHVVLRVKIVLVLIEVRDDQRNVLRDNTLALLVRIVVKWRCVGPEHLGFILEDQRRAVRVELFVQLFLEIPEVLSVGLSELKAGADVLHDLSKRFEVFRFLLNILAVFIEILFHFLDQALHWPLCAFLLN